MSYVDPQQYSAPALPVQGYDTADSVSSSYAKRAQPSECSLVNIVSQSGDQTSGGQILINLANTPNTFIKNGSVYLRLKLSMRNAAAITARGRALSASPTGSWASLINRITVSCGSNVIEQINNYGLVHHEAILLHASSGNYYQQDMKLLECGISTIDDATGDTVFDWANATVANTERSAILTIPLFLGSLNNPQENKNFPLGLLTGGVQVLIDLASAGNALYYTGAPDGTAPNPNNNVLDYTVSQASLSYEAVKVSSEYMAALRGSLAQQGQLFQMPFVSSLVMNVASSAVLDVVYGLGLNSMKAVLFTQKPSAAGAKPNKYNAVRVLRVYADGKLQNNYNVGDLTTQYAELNRSLGNLASRTSTSGPADMITKYDSEYFYGGVGFNKFTDSSLAMTGTACQQLQFHLESTPTAGDNTYILIFYDAILSASPMSGECSVLR
jgi:hypothetical protein